MNRGLPLEVLGLISPILCSVEGGEYTGLPYYKDNAKASVVEKEIAWLKRELPTYSYDNFDEILDIARNKNRYLPISNWNIDTKNQIVSANSPPDGYDLMDAFSKLSKHYLMWTGNMLFVREGLMVELHEIGLRFPVRHLIQYIYVESYIRHFLSKEQALLKSDQSDQLHTIFQGLRTVIHRGITEGHLHLNSILTPDEVWADHMFNTKKSLHGMSPEDWRLLSLGRRSILLLAIGLLLNPEHDSNPPFFLVPLLDRIEQSRSPQELDHSIKEFDKATNHFIISHNSYLSKKGNPNFHPENNWIFKILAPSVYRTWRNHSTKHMTMTRHIELLNKLHFEVQYLLLKRDHLVAWQEPESSLFLDKSLNIAAKLHSKSDKLRRFVHEVFFRYLTYHCHHWQRGTQSGKTTGLRHFTGTYYANQRKPMANVLEAAGLAFERMTKQIPLKTIEGRISPPNTLNDVMPWILAFSEHRKKGGLERFGLVIHFIKSDKNEMLQKGTHGLIHQVRHAKIRRKVKDDAMRLYRLMVTPNPISPFIVGIDAANLELTTPPEIFAPAFRFLRDYPLDIRLKDNPDHKHGKFYKFYSQLNERRLGMTYHVGEDFRHLVSGLRAIHEVIEFLRPNPGDRLGHATALALSPQVWAAQNGFQAVLPMQECLDTLVWLHHWLGTGHELIGELQIKDRIQRLSRQIYGSSNVTNGSLSNGTQISQVFKTGANDDWNIPTLYDSWRLRQLDPYAMNLNEFVSKQDYKIRRESGVSSDQNRWFDIQSEIMIDVNSYIGSNAAYRLLGLYWFNPSVRSIGDRIIKLDMFKRRDAWLAACEEAQKKMIDLVSQKQLIIEANPSSNRLIGPMSSFSEHPIFQLTLDENNKQKNNVRVTINTDNPGVMATSLSHEYYLLGEILLERGMSEPEVESWLEWLRQNGENGSFVKQMPSMDEPSAQLYLKDIRKRFRHMYKGDSKWRYLFPSPDTSSKSNNSLNKRQDDKLERLKNQILELQSAVNALSSKQDPTPSPDTSADNK